MLWEQACLLGDARHLHAHTNRVKTASGCHGENLQVRNRDGISSVRRLKTPNLGSLSDRDPAASAYFFMFRTRAPAK